MKMKSPIPKVSGIISAAFTFVFLMLSSVVMSQNVLTSADLVPPSDYDYVNQKNSEKESVIPFLSEKTQYMVISDLYGNPIHNVSEGMFCVKNGDNICVWTVDGDLLFSPKWKAINVDDEMLFDHGALLVMSAEKNAQGKDYYAILYNNCTVKNLNPTWQPATPFMDGLAIINKKDGYRTVETFFMNVKGEKIPSPVNLYANSCWDIRPLRCGLRAFQNHDRKWGFVDENQKVVFEPKWDMVRNFSEGYAWVFEKDKESFSNKYKVSLIDTKGNIVYDIPSMDVYGNIATSNDLGDVNDGIYYVRKDNGEVALFKLPKKQIATVSDASSFHNGVALVLVKEQSHSYVVAVDKDLKRIAAYPSYDDKGYYISPSELCVSNLFESSDFAVIESGTKVIDNKGRFVLISLESTFSNGRVSGFKKFGKDGYAVMDKIRVDDFSFLALVNAEGEIVWLFSKEKIKKDILKKLPHNQNWENCDISYTDSNVQPCVKVKGGNGGENKENNNLSEYLCSIKVSCVPEEGGKANIPGPDKVKYGTKVDVVATPNSGWLLYKIEVNGKRIFERTFEVTDESDVKVFFKKREIVTSVPPTHTTKDDADPPQKSNPPYPPKGSEDKIRYYQGTLPIDVFREKDTTHVDIYAEISSSPIVSSPYGDDTYGFLAIMIDPKKKFEGNFSTYLFCAPFKLIGYQHDSQSNKTYMLLDGGCLAYHDFHAVVKGAVSLFTEALIRTNDWSTPIAEARRYRIEIIDQNPETGEFTLGGLEAFSDIWREWLPGEDCRLHIIKETKRGSYKDIGMAYDDFMNCKLKKSQKRNDVCWYPPMEWYDNNKNKYDEAIRKMKVTYKEYGKKYDQFFIFS